MSKKPSKHTQRQQEERAALNNIFTSFLVGLAAECYLFIIYQVYHRGTVDSLLLWYDILKVLVWVGLAVFAGGAVFAFVKRRSEKLLYGGVIAAGVGAFLSVSSWVMTRFFDNGVIIMCTAVPILTILALIYFLYQRDCFLNTVILSGTLFTLWVCDRGLDSGWKLYITIGCAALIAVLAAVIVLSFLLRRTGGKLGKLQLMKADCDFRMIAIVAAAALVLVVLGLLIPAFSYYLIWAGVLALFAELAYYTAKLM